MELVGGFLYNQNYNQLADILPSSWIKSQWNFAWEHDITFKNWKTTIPLLRQNDCYIISTLIDAGASSTTIQTLNKCRKYLRIVILADITNGSGTHIIDSVFEGRRPDIPKPSTRDWSIRNQFMRATFTTGSNTRTLRKKLGKWHKTIIPDHQWFYDH